MSNKEFEEITNKIVNNRKFLKLKNEKHHFVTNRYEHNLNVAFSAYKISKFLRLDYTSITKAALVHDFYFSDDFKKEEKELLHHPVIALRNAKNITNLSEKQENIILSHMFPFGKSMPRCKESIIVDLVDDVISFKEICLGSIKYVNVVVSFFIIILFNYMK